MAAASKVLTTVGGSAIAATSIGYGIGETTRTKFPTIREHLELSNFKILNPNESEEEWNKISQALKTPVNDLKERCKDLLETTFWTLNEKYIEASVKCAEEKTFGSVLERAGLTKIDENNKEHVEFVKNKMGESDRIEESKRIKEWFDLCKESDNNSYRKSETYEEFLAIFQTYLGDCVFSENPKETPKLSYWTEKNMLLSTYFEASIKGFEFIQFENEQEWKKTLKETSKRERKELENDPAKISEKIIQLKLECQKTLNTPIENYETASNSEEFRFAVEKCTKLKKFKEIKWWYSLLTSEDEAKLKMKWEIIKKDSGAKLRAESYGFKSNWEDKETSAQELLKICVDKREEYANFLLRSAEDLYDHWTICSDSGAT